MGNVHWVAKALPVAQVYTIQITAYDATTTYKVTINSKTISTLGVTDEDGTAAALKALLASATAPKEFQEITWTVLTDTITGTAKTAGVPFTVAASVSGGAGTISGTAVTAADGPNFWDNINNWDTGAVPVSTDDVYFDMSTTPALYNIDQNTVILASLNIPATYTGSIGLPVTNKAGYPEYRNRSLKISATIVAIGYGPGPGLSFLDLNTGTNATAIVAKLSPQQNTATPTFIWTGSHANNTFELLGGSVGAAFYSGTTCRAAFSIGGSSNIYCGAGATINSWTQSGGTAETNSAISTVTKTGGQLTISAGAITTLLNYGGTVIPNGTGTYTTITLGAGATLDGSQDIRQKTVTNPIICYKGAKIIDPLNLFVDSGIIPTGCAIGDLQLTVLPGKTWTPA